MSDKIFLTDIDWDNVVMEPLVGTVHTDEPQEITYTPPSKKAISVQFLIPFLKLAWQIFIMIVVLAFGLAMVTTIKSIQNGDTPPYDLTQLSVMVVALVFLTLAPMLLKLTKIK